MATTDNHPADLEEEGISIWLALVISIALLLVGFLLSRASGNAAFIPYFKRLFGVEREVF